MESSVKGTLVATLVAGLFGCGGASADQPPQTPAAAKVKCVGINSCHGTSECGGIEGNTCAGTNTCRGKGWIKVSAEECAAKKGHPL